jgi:hypothetical protein
MLKNSVYNLMESASVISKGLSRYDTFKKDAHDCQQCQQIWDYMKKADEEQLTRMTDHLKAHFLKEGEVSKAA